MATRHIILLVFVIIDLINITASKTTFQKELDELKYTVLDLSAELVLERYRTDRLEKQLNETLKGGLGAGEGESKGPSNNAAIEKLQKKIENQEKLLKQNAQKLENEKVKRVSLEATLQSMKDKCDLLDNQTTLIKSQQSMIEDMKENLTNLAKATSNLEENFSTGKLKETNQIKSSMGLFTQSIKLAFKTEKALLRNAKRPLRNNEMVTKMIKDELEAVKGDTKVALEKIKTNMTNMQINIDEVSDLVISTGKTLETLDTTFTYNLQKLNSTIALLETKVEDNRERIVEISECCSQKCKTVPCSSLNYKYTSCPVIEAQDITKVTLTIKYSKSACTYGTSYGPGTGSIWVDKGCRGSFEVCYNKKQVCTTLDCSSIDYKFALCDVPGAGTVTTIAVNHKYSKSACDFGHGFGSYADKIWVHHGCRANFKACYTK